MKMKQKKTYLSLVVVLILGMLISACSTQVDVTGQLNNETGTGSLNIDIGGGSNNSGEMSPSDGSSQNSNAQPILSTQGLLILIGVGLVVMIGLLIGLTRAKDQ